ncbi:MAG TPA: GTPase RsgA [Actinotalea sp.]|nr:GTPase RsgA [Actinotalea sp.]
MPHPLPHPVHPDPPLVTPGSAAPTAAAGTSTAPGATHAVGLARLGWDEGWSAALAHHLDGHATSPPVVGRVTRADRGACDVLVAPPHAGDAADAPDLRRVHGARWAPELSRAAAADAERTPAAGDWVLLRGPVLEAPTTAPDGPSAAPDLPGTWTVTGVLDRRTAVRRADAEPGSSRAQVLAANADVVAVVEPMPGVPGRVERLLALAWASGARPVVVLTKADLQADPDDVVARVTAVAPGVDVLPVAAPDGHGLDPLRALLAAGATLALVGASGVGKSTLLNALVLGTGSGTVGAAPGGEPSRPAAPGEQLEVMRTQPVRSDGKGRHTTVTRELHLAPGGGAVLDTPGVRTVGLAGAEELEDVFPEVAELAARCRFADCAHRSEPGCAVQAAVADGELPERRLASYRRLEREAAARAARVDVRLRAEQRRELTLRQREYRRRPDKKR